MSPTAAQWEWVAGPDSGMSSAAIWTAMTGCAAGRYGEPDAIPMDDADLGRCIRLLDRFPEWRPHLHEMAQRNPAWAPIVEHWVALVAAYRAEAPGRWGDRPALDAMLRKLYRGRCCCGRHVLGSGVPAGERHGRNGCEWRAAA